MTCILTCSSSLRVGQEKSQNGGGFQFRPSGRETPRWEWVQKLERLTVKDSKEGSRGSGRDHDDAGRTPVQVLEEGREAN